DDFAVFYFYNRQTGKFDWLIRRRDAESFACVRGTNGASGGGFIAFGDYVIYRNLQIGISRAKSAVQNLKTFRSANRIAFRVAQTVCDSVRREHFVNRFLIAFVPDFLKPSMQKAFVSALHKISSVYRFTKK